MVAKDSKWKGNAETTGKQLEVSPFNLEHCHWNNIHRQCSRKFQLLQKINLSQIEKSEKSDYMAKQRQRRIKRILEIPEYVNTTKVNVTRTYSQNPRTDELNDWSSMQEYMRYIVPFNSDTLFRCAARGLFLSNVNFVTVKAAVCAYLRAHRNEYEMRVKLAYHCEQNTLATWKINGALRKLGQEHEEIAGKTQSIWDVYMYRLENTKHGGGLIEAEIISKIYKCDVYIFRDFRNEPLIYYGEEDGTRARHELLLVSLYGTTNHFDALLPIIEKAPAGIVQSFIYKSLYEQTFHILDPVKQALDSQKDRQERDKKKPYTPSKKLPFPRQVEGCLDPDQFRNPFFAFLRNERRIIPDPDDIWYEDGSEDPPEYNDCSDTEFITEYHDPIFDFEPSSGPVEHSFYDFWEMLGRSDLIETVERSQSVLVKIHVGEPHLESVVEDAEDADRAITEKMDNKLKINRLKLMSQQVGSTAAHVKSENIKEVHTPKPQEDLNVNDKAVVAKNETESGNIEPPQPEEAHLVKTNYENVEVHAQEPEKDKNVHDEALVGKSETAPRKIEPPQLERADPVMSKTENVRFEDSIPDKTKPTPQEVDPVNIQAEVIKAKVEPQKENVYIGCSSTKAICNSDVVKQNTIPDKAAKEEANLEYKTENVKSGHERKLSYSDMAKRTKNETASVKIEQTQPQKANVVKSKSKNVKFAESKPKSENVDPLKFQAVVIKAKAEPQMQEVSIGSSSTNAICSSDVLKQSTIPEKSSAKAVNVEYEDKSVKFETVPDRQNVRHVRALSYSDMAKRSPQPVKPCLESVLQDAGDAECEHAQKMCKRSKLHPFTMTSEEVDSQATIAAAKNDKYGQLRKLEKTKYVNAKPLAAQNETASRKIKQSHPEKDHVVKRNPENVKFVESKPDATKSKSEDADPVKIQAEVIKAKTEPQKQNDIGSSSTNAICFSDVVKQNNIPDKRTSEEANFENQTKSVNSGHVPADKQILSHKRKLSYSDMAKRSPQPLKVEPYFGPVLQDAVDVECEHGQKKSMVHPSMLISEEADSRAAIPTVRNDKELELQKVDNTQNVNDKVVRNEIPSVKIERSQPEHSNVVKKKYKNVKVDDSKTEMTQLKSGNVDSLKIQTDVIKAKTEPHKPKAEELISKSGPEADQKSFSYSEMVKKDPKSSSDKPVEPVLAEFVSGNFPSLSKF